MKYFYYPGCSLRGMGKAYEESWLKVCQKIGLHLEEIEDWNCCGSTTYLGFDEIKSLVLVSRNLAMLEKEGGSEVITPCIACYYLFNRTNHNLRDYPQLKIETNKMLQEVGLTYSGNVKVRHPLDVLVNDGWMEKISENIEKRLERFKAVCYYGCQLLRPYCEFDNPRNPKNMDILVSLTGVDVLDYPLKTKCCGAIITSNIPEKGLELVYVLLKEAKKRKADFIVVTCPLCQFNLESQQEKIMKVYEEDVGLPILYYTQVLGLAMGISLKELGITRCLTLTPEFERVLI